MSKRLRSNRLSHLAHGETFPTARQRSVFAPSKTGSNWLDESEGAYKRYKWTGEDRFYIVQEMEGPGVSIYKLYAFWLPDPHAKRIELKYRRQLKTAKAMFAIAHKFDKQLMADHVGFIVDHHQWQRLA